MELNLSFQTAEWLTHGFIMISFKRALLVAAAAVSPMVASASVVASGVADITGTYSFDFDTGTQGNYITDLGQDVFWEQITSTTRQLTVENGALIINLGAINFNSLTAATLQSLSFGRRVRHQDIGWQLRQGDRDLPIF
jgi:hypothetical protein